MTPTRLDCVSATTAIATPGADDSASVTCRHSASSQAPTAPTAPAARAPCHRVPKLKLPHLCRAEQGKEVKEEEEKEELGESLPSSALNKEAGWKMGNVPSAVCLMAGWWRSNGKDSGHLLVTAGETTGDFNCGRHQQNNCRLCSSAFVKQHDTVYFLMSHVASPHTL